MIFDVFFSICQTEVDGYLPNEREMFQNFFDQINLADELGFDIAWIAESHLSCQVQKTNPNAVIPYFKGEIGLNTDIFQIAHKAFQKTKRIQVGSAIRNILCNGGPLAHAEGLKTFLSLHGLDPNETRKLHLGYASGRFPFSNRPYGIKPRNSFEQKHWFVVKGAVFKQAIEIFLKALDSQAFASADINPIWIQRDELGPKKDWHELAEDARRAGLEVSDQLIQLANFWNFENVGIMPFECHYDLLQLVLGSHDPSAQKLANQYRPHWVFNLSITPSSTIETTHELLSSCFHPDGGTWQRSNLPRTVLIFVNGDPDADAQQQRERAKRSAEKALANYWQALEGTLDSRKVNDAVENAIYGNPDDVAKQIKAKFNQGDRLMLWFDFNNHDNEAVKRSMQVFWEQVRPQVLEGQ
jgi:alkanesulfonate monooxygenase SsuD/methylene tetrahydromethanopterin reductase-like flavin-dependent oxidoreductase (luciferase family)